MLNLSRFVEVSYVWFDTKEVEVLGSDHPSLKPQIGRRKICVDDIVAYETAHLYPHVTMTEKERVATCVYLRQGLDFVCNMPFSEFENLLSDFDVIDYGNPETQKPFKL